jgi:dTDP-4-amino-4,6-dideoxygalactose transaminase
MPSAKLALKGGTPAVDKEKALAHTQFHGRYPLLLGEEIEAVVRLMRDGMLSIGGREDVVADFEDAFAAYHGIKYALSCNSGTASLYCAYEAAGAAPGVEVITTPFTFITTVTAILACGAIPIFADLDPKTGNITAETIERCISPYTKAISVVHVWGHPADMDPIMELARKHNLIVVEDCSHAHGATYKGRKVGTIGHLGAFSLQASKNIIAGEGGALITDDEDLYQRAVVTGHHVTRLKEVLANSEYRFFADSGPLHKLRAAPIACAIALEQLKRLDYWNEQRQASAALMSKELEGVSGFRPCYLAPDCTHGLHVYGFDYVPEELDGLPREATVRALNAEGVPVGTAYSRPIYLTEMFQRRTLLNWSPWACPPAKREVRYAQGDCPNCEQRAWRTGLMMMWNWMIEPMPELIKMYGEAFRKVSENHRELAG